MFPVRAAPSFKTWTACCDSSDQGLASPTLKPPFALIFVLGVPSIAQMQAVPQALTLLLDSYPRLLIILQAQFVDQASWISSQWMCSCSLAKMSSNNSRDT